MKLKEEKERNNDAIAPEVPEAEVATIKGIKVTPSNKADEAFPKDGSDKSPDTMSIRSGSTTPLAECVSCKGTIVSWETAVSPWNVEPVKYVVEYSSRNEKCHVLPKGDHWTPFQNDKNADDPSVDLPIAG